MSSQTGTMLDALIRSLEKARSFNRQAEIEPIAVLWPDEGRQWERALPLVRQRLPVLTLGAFDADHQTGPAIWIRAQLARWAEADIPIVYLPGIGKDHLRDISQASIPMEPLLYLQYRGTTFMQPNGRDWTISAYLQNKKEGLGLTVDASEATRSALTNTLPVLIRRRIDELRHIPGGIDAGYLNGIILTDLPRQILEWIGDPATAQAAMEEEKWTAFCQQLRSKYGVDPVADGASEAARRLGTAEPGDGWYDIWERFLDHPAGYPGLPERLRGAKPAGTAQRTLFVDIRAAPRWPQDNEEAEEALRQALRQLDAAPDVESARKRVEGLEADHGIRRASAWGKLDQTPLADALQHLTLIGKMSANRYSAVSLTSLQTYYTQAWWKIDAAALEALRAVSTSDDRETIQTALQALYTPWLREAADHFQEAVRKAPPPVPPQSLDPPPGTCLVFADGLRYDLAALLARNLAERGLTPNLTSALGPIPGITPSAKPAQSPVADLLAPGTMLDVKIAATGSAWTQSGFTKLLSERGWLVLASGEVGLPDGQMRGWTETGDIDSYGHDHPNDLPRQAFEEIEKLARRISDLLGAGWRQVMVITDHGWLLTPRSMTKTDLPQAVTVQRKGRCARLKPGAVTALQTVPWSWDSTVDVALAPGITCFEAGVRYDHGGLSLQESIVPTLTIAAPKSASLPVTVGSVDWRGLRADIMLSGGGSGVTVDLRVKVSDATTSLVKGPVAPDSDGGCTLLVLDDANEERAATVVVCDAQGQVVAQHATIVGGE